MSFGDVTPAPPPDPGARVVYAGTESTVEHHGYMEGAVRAAEAAAKRVRARAV
jgi:monoamine oxidase